VSSIIARACSNAFARSRCVSTCRRLSDFRMRPDPPRRNVPPFAPGIVAAPSGMPSRGPGTSARLVTLEPHEFPPLIQARGPRTTPAPGRAGRPRGAR
jgi:hypothetical protein